MVPFGSQVFTLTILGKSKHMRMMKKEIGSSEKVSHIPAAEVNPTLQRIKRLEL